MRTDFNNLKVHDKILIKIRGESELVKCEIGYKKINSIYLFSNDDRLDGFKPDVPLDTDYLYSYYISVFNIDENIEGFFKKDTTIIDFLLKKIFK